MIGDATASDRRGLPVAGVPYGAFVWLAFRDAGWV